MSEDDMRHTSLIGQVGDFSVCRVSPCSVRLYLRRKELSVMYQDIDTATESLDLVHTVPALILKPKFIVGNESNPFIVILKAEGVPVSGMIKVHSLDFYILDNQRFGHLIMKFDIGAQGIIVNREVSVVVTLVNIPPQYFLSHLITKHGNGIYRIIGGTEKRESRQVIPMRVGQEQDYLIRIPSLEV